MKRFIVVIVVVLLCSMIAVAQEEKVQVFGGWQFTSIDSKDIMGRQSAPKGWNADLAIKATKNFAIVADISGAYKSQSGTIDVLGESFTGVGTAHLHNFLFGPRFMATSGKVTPFAEVLVGAGHGSLKAKIEGTEVGSTSATGLAFAFGGGLDVHASKNIAIRLAKFDYVMNRMNFSDLGTGSQTLNNYRIATGIVFKF